MLSGDNGIINKASEVGYINEITYFDEQTKLLSMSVSASIQSNIISKEEYIATNENNLIELAREAIRGLGLKDSDLIKYGDGTKLAKDGYTVAYYLDHEGNPNTDGDGYIVIWYTSDTLKKTINVDEAKSIYKLTEKRKLSNSIDQIVLAAVISVKNHNCDLSKLLLTSLSDGDDDTTKGKFQNTSLSDSSDIGSNIETTETYIKIDNVTINVDKNFNTWSVPQYGTTLNSGLVLMSSDYYVIVRDQQYLNNNDAKDSFINNYCVKLNVDKGFTTPSQETVKGDLTLGQGNQVGDNFLENGKVYVYTPYNNPAPADGYKYRGWWKEVK